MYLFYAVNQPRKQCRLVSAIQTLPGNNLECVSLFPTLVTFLDKHLGERFGDGFDPRINLSNFGYYPGSDAGLGYRSVEVPKGSAIANNIHVFPDKLVTKVT